MAKFRDPYWLATRLVVPKNEESKYPAHGSDETRGNGPWPPEERHPGDQSWRCRRCSK